MSEPASGSESTRDLASQRQPSDSHFETPAWVGPDRHPGVPEQPSPAHDDLAAAAPEAPAAPRTPAPTEPDIIASGHWTGSTAGRTAWSLVLIALLIASLGAGVATWRDPSGGNVVLLVVCVLAAVGLWAALATTRPMVVDLKGSLLTVHHHSTVDTFDLADPFQPVEIRGALGSPSWSLVLGRPDGTTVAVGSRTVRAAQLHPAVVHYRRLADRRRGEREQRFTR